MSDKVQLTATRLYKTGAKAPVFISVTIGENQVGGTTIIFDGNSIGPDNGEITNLQVGKEGDNLQYKLLICTTDVRDINTATNKTSVIYTLSGGDQEQEFPFTIDVDQQGGFAMYSITFAFV